ncbi:MAG: right-handed parallel beta-helix repeat-containing protein, partial [Alphaproteobacteria bacterium]|nr:right-handed parallel beta-helix repeat-containing protein [Alphaproteobacteria bacterium]
MSTFQTRTKNVNRFGSAGRRLLSTSAIAVVSLAALSVGQSASADTGPWTEWDSQNNFTVQSNGQTTDIHTTANIAGGNSPDLDIDAGEAVNVFQQGSGSLFYGRAADDADPTQILGALWSNGRLLIIDRNGVFFGPGSQIDTAGIVASTGDISDADIFDGDNKFSFDNFGEGAITIEGTVNVGQAGLAAFVSPTVVNNGVINAKMGTVSFAAGEKVTLDLYGDGLVEVAVEGELADALLENKGQINAAGGTVQMSALAAKGAVDNIVNMDGVITVASAEVKGGKIILSGGDSGKVAVSGKLDASGTTGGEIDVTGQNVEIAGTAELSADATDGNGDGGRVEIIAQDKAIFRGLISARGGDVSGQGGFVDTSGLGAIDVAGGVVDTRASNGTAGLWLIDPTDITVVFSVPGPLDPVPTTNSTIGWNQIMAALGLSNITIRTDGGAGGNGDIFFGATTPSNSITSLFRPSGENRDLTFDADRNIVVNEGLNFSGVGTLNLNAGGRLILNKDLTVVDIFDGVLNPDDGIAQGNLNITTAEIDLFANLEVQRTLNSTATTVNVAQVPLSFGNTGAEIQDGVDVAAAGGTVNVGAGTYHEDVIIDKALTLNGANSGLHGNDGGRGPESIVTPGTVGFLITGNNTVIDGFEIVGGEAGVIVDGGNNAIIRNNNIHGQFAPSGEGASFGAPGEGDGVYVTNSAGTKILRNKIADYNDDGVQASGVSDFEIADNLIADNGNGDLAIGVSNASGSLDITGNEITNARRQGVQVLSSTVTANISGNTVANAATTQAGISIQGTNGDISIDDNTVSGGLIGINIHTSDNVLVGDKDGDNDSGNTVIGSGRGISVFGSTDTEVVDNTLTGVGSGIAGIQSENIQIVDNNVTGASTVGIDIIDSDSADVDNNIVTHFTTGIRVTNSDLVDIEGNTITDIAENGIEVSGSALVDVQDNAVGGASANDVGGDGIHIVSSLGADVRGNTVRNADGDGIELISSDSSNVGGFGGGDRNTIRNVGGHGIVSSFGTSPDILNNDVAFTGLNGIHLNGGTDAQVRRNLVDETGRDGIEANGNLDIQITDNRIGTRAGAGNIGGEGIDVNNSPSADILNNVVSNTVSNGISINPSHGSVIQGNTITNAGAHGILSSGSDNILIRSNRIDLTVLDGIRFANGNTVTIDGNRISNTGRGGIWAHNSSNVTIDNNSVLNAGTAQTWSGIVANNNDGVRITRNRVDTTSFDGIHAGFNPGNTGAANTNVVIDGNTVLNARVRGIYSV